MKYLLSTLLLFVAIVAAAQQAPAKDPIKTHKASRNSDIPVITDIATPAVEPAKLAQHKSIVNAAAAGQNPFGKTETDPGVNGPSGAENTHFTIVDSVHIKEAGDEGSTLELPIFNTNVVLATVTAGHSYLGDNGGGIHSIYDLHIDNIISAGPAPKPLTVGDEVSAYRMGGAVRFPSGHVLYHLIYRQGFPKVGTQYLVFLRWAPTINSFAIDTAYEVRADSTVAPLDDNGGPDNPGGTWEGKKLTELIAAINAAKGSH